MNDDKKNVPEPSIPTDATNTAPDEKFREFSKLFSPANPGPITPVDGSRATNETNSTGTAQIRKKEDILLNKEDAYERTPVKDPLFAAKILEEEQKPYVSSTQIPTREEIPIPARIEPEEKILKPLRTYQGDVAETLKKQKTSVVQMVLAEHEKKERSKEESRATSKRNLPIVAVIALLALVGVGVLGGGAIYFINKRAAQTPVEKLEIPSIIFVETAKELSITGRTPDSLTQAISTEVANAKPRLDTILNVYFTKLIGGAPESISVRVSAQEFFTALASAIPDTLLRSLNQEFMFGIHAFNGNEPFILLKTNFFENSFAGMLKWEERMAREILPLFGTSVEGALADKKFQDIVVKNRDLRALLNEQGDIVLLYTFYDRETLIITRTTSTLDEVITRLTRPKK
ncbi:MAG: hypothetical protein AAB769_01845 [Patescibacteria group bacterium]